MLDKYKAAATVANSVLEAIKAKAVEGANLLELCAEGDKLLEAGTAGLYNKAKGMPKGELWSLVFVAAGLWREVGRGGSWSPSGSGGAQVRTDEFSSSALHADL